MAQTLAQTKAIDKDDSYSEESKKCLCGTGTGIWYSNE